LTLCLLSVLAVGCDSLVPMTVAFKPNGKGPLSSLKPLTVLIRVEDQRPPAERDSVYQNKAATGATDTFYTKKPVPLIVQDALMSELSKCGHRAVHDPTTTVDVRVNITLKRFRAFYSIARGLSAEVEAEVVVINEAKKATTPAFQISGNYQQRAVMAATGWTGASDALSKALAEFVHNLTFDSRLVETLP
jgi:Uncharacterized lipoprotein